MKMKKEKNKRSVFVTESAYNSSNAQFGLERRKVTQLDATTLGKKLLFKEKIRLLFRNSSFEQKFYIYPSDYFVRR